MRIIAVLGDYYHEEAPLREALSQVMNKLQGVELIYSIRKDLKTHLKTNPELVILGSENRIDPTVEEPNEWMRDLDEISIIEYVENGGSWLAWHSGLASYENNASYTDMIGGYFKRHPEKHVTVRYQYRENHDLGKGEDGFSITDEHYFIEQSEGVSVFLESISEHGESVAGWSKRYGKGKVCAFIPAHNREGLLDASVQDGLRNVIEWLSD